MARLKVKYGTYANYMSLVNASPSQVNADTLYFITDRGLIYKGSVLVTNKITISSSGSGSSEQLTITDNSTSSPFVYTVNTSSAIAAIKQTLETALQTHAALNGRSPSGTAGTEGYNDGRGHVALSDATDSDLDTDDATAATPLAVSSALRAAKQYADNLLAGLSGAMVFKGVLGSGSHDTASLPTTVYKAGWTYYVGEAGTYAGYVCEIGDIVVAVKDYVQGSLSNDWSVIQKNIDGAVTAANDLANNSLVLGNGNKTVKTLAGTDTKQWLKWTSSGPSWSIPYMYELGSGYLECDTAANTAAKTAVAPSSFRLKMGGIIAVKFTFAVPANATLNISATGANAIYYRGSAITADIILAGDTAIMVFEDDPKESRWHVIGINKPIDNSVAQNSKNPVSGGAVYTELGKKQDTLFEGTGIHIENHITNNGGTSTYDGQTVSVDFGEVEDNDSLPVSGGDVYDAISDALNWVEITAAQSGNE